MKPLAARSDGVPEAILPQSNGSSKSRENARTPKAAALWAGDIPLVHIGVPDECDRSSS